MSLPFASISNENTANFVGEVIDLEGVCKEFTLLVVGSLSGGASVILACSMDGVNWVNLVTATSASAPQSVSVHHFRYVRASIGATAPAAPITAYIAHGAVH